MVERFEGDVAVVCGEGNRFWNLPRWMLPSAAREGVYLLVRTEMDGAAARTLRVVIDARATEAAAAEARSLADRLRARDAGGDWEL